MQELFLGQKKPTNNSAALKKVEIIAEPTIEKTEKSPKRETSAKMSFDFDDDDILGKIMKDNNPSQYSLSVYVNNTFLFFE